ncbi:MAG: glycosyltransferase [Proteocatella sp.]
MKIAFFTPLTPLKSGVSDFAEELLLGFKKYTNLEIELFIGNYTPSNKLIIDNFKIRKFKDFEDEKVRSQYDEVIYQIGNNQECHEEIYNIALKYPGIVELHDVALHHLIAGMTIANGKIEQYKKIMRYCHGEGALDIVDKFLNQEILPPWETDSLTFTVNKKIVDAAKGIIVHSDFANQMIKGIRPDISTQLIYLHTPDIYENYEELKFLSRKELNIKSEESMISTFGFATKPKRILETLEALYLLKKEGYKFKYYIAGEVDKNLHIEKKISELKLDEDVVITGFLKLDHMKKLMLSTDICMALRYPSQGESSGVLHRMFGMGKLIVVTDINNFSEYPDNVLLKVNMENEIDSIKETISNFINESEKRTTYEKSAFKFANEKCNLQINSILFESYIKNPFENKTIELEDLIVDKLLELEICEVELVEKLLNTIILK